MVTTTTTPTTKLQWIKHSWSPSTLSSSRYLPRRNNKKRQKQRHPFDTLPEELTLEIFVHLDSLSLYRVTQTSLRYRHTISRCINLWTCLWFDPTLPLERRDLYRMLCFLVEHHGLHEQVRGARFDRCTIDSTTLERVLRYLPRLSTLSVVGCPQLDCFQFLSILRHTTAPLGPMNYSLPPSRMLPSGPLLQHLTRLEIRGLFPSERGIMSYAHEIYCYTSIRRLLAKNNNAARQRARRISRRRHLQARVLEGFEEEEDDVIMDDEDEDEDDEDDDLLMYHQFWLLLQQPLFRASPELLVLPSTAATFSALSSITHSAITTTTTTTTTTSSTVNSIKNGRNVGNNGNQRRSIEMDVQPCSHCHRNVTQPTPASCTVCGDPTLTPCAQCMCYHCRRILCRSCFRLRRGWRVLRCHKCQLARRVCSDTECITSLHNNSGHGNNNKSRPWKRRGGSSSSSSDDTMSDFYCAWCIQKKNPRQRLPWIRRLLWMPDKQSSSSSSSLFNNRPPLYLNN
ncbi:predicted protein [Lichtheimia corymbifera JMRC:FSU:9682]|uniref:F-box domain-containing protein n=1 Tax=Lichtheimia corymbifera JMRC:FSU:9682 TaxID=1263082 RepID=A0A068RFN2_9FUNG|nr:predicted protein [Lichtheimia corymbifera JMRC:FSU:9682]